MNFDNIELAAAELRNEPWVTPVSMNADPAVRAYLAAATPTRVHELVQIVKRHAVENARLVLELAAEVQRADMLLEQGKLAAAQVQAEQQRIAALGEELAAAKAAIPAQTGMQSLGWDAVNSAANTANNNFGQWMPELWLQEFVKAYNASIPAQPVQQPAPVCSHPNKTHGYDYVECIDCGAFRTDTDADWGIAAGKWFKSRAEANFYQENGRLPSDAAPVAAPVAMPADSVQPVDMILHCPVCRAQHIDAAEEAEVFDTGNGTQYEMNPDRWDNPPHRSHLCHECGHIWRPADVATNGVAAINTKGSADSVQPDIGRDAALVAELRSVYSIYNGHGEDLRDLADRAADRIAALAAHPANVAQPVDDADNVKHDVANRLALWLSASMDQHSATDEMRKHIRAWLDHQPANVAQVGEVDFSKLKKGEPGWRPSFCDRGKPGSTCCDHGCAADIEQAEILAAAKKGPTT